MDARDSHPEIAISAFWGTFHPPQVSDQLNLNIHSVDAVFIGSDVAVTGSESNDSSVAFSLLPAAFTRVLRVV